MLKNLIKKGKGNKGFTLIELIVVIAIIAILALILVPRFAGFTDTAATRTNDSNKKTIETAVNVLIAEGKLSGTGGFDVLSAVDVDNLTGTLLWRATPTSGTATATDVLIEPELQKLVGNKMTPAGGVTAYTVTITAGNVTVS